MEDDVVAQLGDLVLGGEVRKIRGPCGRCRLMRTGLCGNVRCGFWLLPSLSISRLRS
jgi:hypothetical protein